VVGQAKCVMSSSIRGWRECGMVVYTFPGVDAFVKVELSGEVVGAVMW
jgi:hypothetical protein